MFGGHVVFLINLLQDVNVVRPLALLAANRFGASVLFLVSERFIQRDTGGAWQRELQEMSAQAGATIRSYDSEYAALRVLYGRRGLLIAGSESSLSAHAQTHNVMRVAPPDFLKVTLQHGFECVGFMHSREHDKAFGRYITFAADVICGWCDAASMRSLVPSERSKYLLTGPASLMYEAAGTNRAQGGHGGLVCENLHSVRMHASGDFKVPYMDTFSEFAGELAKTGSQVTLRPHPGGQYVLKNKVELPANVRINNQPMYKVDLGRYDYGISAPSSVIIDMVIAGVAVAVWRDEQGAIDTSSYDGLTMVSGLQEWLDFVQDARERREAILERQAAFLARTRMQVDRQKVLDSYSKLLARGLSLAARRERPPPVRTERVLLVANSLIPTLQLSFIEPLAPDVAEGKLVVATLMGDDVTALFADAKGRLLDDFAAKRWVRRKFEEFSPTLVVLCRYSAVLAEYIVELAHEFGAAVSFHIDDDLLNVPIEIGVTKFRAHNRPERLARVRYLLENADIVYCSTRPLLQRFRELGFSGPMVCGELYCSGRVLTPAKPGPVRKIGYMGFDHAHDLELILPSIVHALRTHPEVTFELFGSIPKPQVLEEFGARVVKIEPVRGYKDFLQKFASLGWDIGVCPLVATPFNRVKANTKWVEYTAVGAAVIASKGMAYDECCLGGCGILADTQEDWTRALDQLCAQPQLKEEIVRAAQKRMVSEYSEKRLRNQVWDVFRIAHQNRLPRIASHAL